MIRVESDGKVIVILINFLTCLLGTRIKTITSFKELTSFRAAKASQALLDTKLELVTPAVEQRFVELGRFKYRSFFV
ncbi:hypothetical protein FYL25_10285 [Lactobacillus salivarius]|uniref:Uncharacterized protein n=1 Tax=Ligilactobacillus salivarius TaxID=1624 RepID=A0A6N9ITR0_9LACO|nr:hypothetical protein [Ligilactobacillus salivarius]